MEWFYHVLWMLVDSSIGPTFFGNIRTSLLNFTRTYDDSRVEDLRLWSGEVLKIEMNLGRKERRSTGHESSLHKILG